MGRFEQRVALVTGGARGQGRSHVLALAAEGAAVITVDACEDQPGTAYAGPREADLEETARLVSDAGGQILARRADVRNLAELREVVEEGVSQFGGLDIVIANAGIAGPPNRSEDIPEPDFVDMLDVNLVGVWRTTTAAIPHIRAGGKGGSIVLTGSVAGLMGMPNVAHYVVAKHGVVGLTRALALELAEDMIRVNSLSPTVVDTPMVQNDAMYQLFRPELDSPGRDDFAEAAIELNALPVPWVETLDCTNAALFLASDEARYITGVALPVDAGAFVK